MGESYRSGQTKEGSEVGKGELPREPKFSNSPLSVAVIAGQTHAWALLCQPAFSDFIIKQEKAERGDCNRFDAAR
jgi:hypothetical protein